MEQNRKVRPLRTRARRHHDRQLIRDVAAMDVQTEDDEVTRFAPGMVTELLAAMCREVLDLRKLADDAQTNELARELVRLLGLADTVSIHPEHDDFLEQLDELARIIEQLRFDHDERRGYGRAQLLLRDLRHWLRQMHGQMENWQPADD